MRGRLLGPVMLVLASLLWGSSFPTIKVLMSSVDPATYVWLRGLFSTLLLAPYVAWRAVRGGLDRSALRGGLRAGAAYTAGLWLQGWGTAYTTASNSAFITALHVVFVHAYVALVSRRYGARLGLALVACVIGAYMLTGPSTGLNRGDLLVLIGSLGWAAQVILVSRYCRGDPLQFVFAQFLASISLAAPDLLRGGPEPLSPIDVALLFYLAAASGVGAFALQVVGQRSVDPAAASVIFQLEPVFAAALARLAIGETMSCMQMAGATLIVFSTMLVGAFDRELSARARSSEPLEPTPRGARPALFS
ncbi:MAG: DMT family transporter [Fervidicoccaceae archaeon]